MQAKYISVYRLHISSYPPFYRKLLNEDDCNWRMCLAPPICSHDIDLIDEVKGSAT